MSQAAPIPDGSVIVTPPGSEPPAELRMTIGVKDIYDTGVATAAAVRELTTDLRDFRRDLEQRVRSLERWRYALAGTASASFLGALTSLLTQMRGG